MKTVEIKRWDNNEVIFSHTCENNTTKLTLEEGVRCGVCFDFAELNHASLFDAKLNGAELNHASLFDAKLNGAELNHAKLNGAELTHASLIHTRLKGARLNNTDLTGTTLDLSSGIPYHCGGTKLIWDDRLFSQHLYHLTRQNNKNLSLEYQVWLKSIPKSILNSFCAYRNDVTPI